MKIKNDTIRKWLTLIIVATAGGLMTKLPYLRETYMTRCRLPPEQLRHSSDF